MTADDDGEAQLIRDVSGFLAKRERHESLASTMPADEFLRLRGLGEVWGLLFDVARSEVTRDAGWAELCLLQDLYRV